jgi:2-dehydropantoate 2-reductase
LRIAVLGAGSLGTVVGALLAKDGLDVWLVDANREHVSALNRDGARIMGQMELTQPVRAITPEQMEGAFDLVIYLAKSVYDEVALPSVLPHLRNESLLLTLQNGIPEEKVASFVGRERTAGGAVGWAAEFTGPGASRLTSDPEQMDYVIGELDGALTERIETVKSVLDHAGRATVSPNLTGVRWTKLQFNVAASGMSTALGARSAQIMASDKAVDAVLFIMVETVLVAQALGVKMEPLRGGDPAAMLGIVKANLPVARDLFRNALKDMTEAKASMLQDLEAGRKCEVESLNGYLQRMARQTGIATSVNDQVTQIIRDIQDGRRKPEFSNLDLLELPPVENYFARGEA